MTAKRDASLDSVRLCAAIAVIFQHVCTANSLRWASRITHFAVPAFTLISVWFTCLRARNDNCTWRTEGSRAWKLYFLFLLWNIVYMGARLIKHESAASGDFRYLTFASTFVDGYGMALWYLPFIAIANYAAFIVSRAALSLSRSSRIILWISCAAIGIGLSLSPAFASTYPVSLVLNIARKAVPSVFFAIAAANLQADLGTLHKRRAVIAIASTLILVAAAISINVYGREVFIWETVGGAAFVLVFWATGLGSSLRIAPTLFLWLFLSHQLFIELSRLLMGPLLAPLGITCTQLTLFMVVCTLCYLSFRVISFQAVPVWFRALLLQR
jgi:hypothetical protein